MKDKREHGTDQNSLLALTEGFIPYGTGLEPKAAWSRGWVEPCHRLLHAMHAIQKKNLVSAALQLCIEGRDAMQPVTPLFRNCRPRPSKLSTNHTTLFSKGQGVESELSPGSSDLRKEKDRLIRPKPVWAEDNPKHNRSSEKAQTAVK